MAAAEVAEVKGSRSWLLPMAAATSLACSACFSSSSAEPEGTDASCCMPWAGLLGLPATDLTGACSPDPLLLPRAAVRAPATRHARQPGSDPGVVA